MSGCGEPYQIESVPHTMRSGPTARSSLPSTCAASTGRRSMRYQVLPSSAYTLAPGADAGVGEARAPGGRRRRALIRVEGALLAVGIALVARVVHEERHVGEGRRRRSDVARRRRRHRRRRDRTAQSLVHRDDRRARRAHALEEREADLVVVEEPPAGRRRGRRRPVERVALPARRPERVVERRSCGRARTVRRWGARWCASSPVPRPRSGRRARARRRSAG